MTRAILLGILLSGTVPVWGQGEPARPDAPSPERAWDLSGMIVLRHGSRVSSACFSPDGALVATAGLDREIRLWNARTGFLPASSKTAARTPPGLDGPVRVACFSPDGAWVASAGEDRGPGEGDGFVVRVNPLSAAGPAALRLRGHPQPVLALAFSPRGDFLVSGGADSKIRIWTLATPAAPRVLVGHPRAVTGLQVSPSGRSIYSVGADGTVREWDVASGEERARWDRGGLRFSGISLSPDGRLLALAELTGTVRVKDLLTGLDRAVFPGRDVSVPAVAFAPDGARLVWGGYDGRLRLGSLEGAPVWAGTLGAWVTSVAFAPEGTWIVAGLADGSAAVLRPPPPDAEPGAPGESDPTALWAALGERDPAAAAAVVRRWSAVLRGDAAPARAGSVSFLKEHLIPIPQGRIDELVRQLDDEEFETRVRASGELERIGTAAEPALRAALAGNPSAEVRQRLSVLLKKLGGAMAAAPEVLRVLRSIEVLERARTAEAAALLGTLAAGVESARETVEARLALERLRKSSAH